MKKTVLSLVIIMGLGFVALNSAEARWGSGWGPGGCNGPRWGQNTNVNSEDRQEFYNDTFELRELLSEKQDEYYSLMNSDNVDKEQAALLWADVFDLQKELQQKAQEAGLSSGNNRSGRFAGRQNGNYYCNGPGSCWTN